MQPVAIGILDNPIDYQFCLGLLGNIYIVPRPYMFTLPEMKHMGMQHPVLKT